TPVSRLVGFVLKAVEPLCEMVADRKYFGIRRLRGQGPDRQAGGKGGQYLHETVPGPEWSIGEVPMAKTILRTGRRRRPKTAAKGKRFRCARCRKRSPKPIKTPAPWYCPNCLKPEEPPVSGLPDHPC